MFANIFYVDWLILVFFSSNIISYTSQEPFRLSRYKQTVFGQILHMHISAYLGAIVARVSWVWITLSNKVNKQILLTYQWNATI